MEALKSSPQQEAFDRTNEYMSLFLQSLDSIDADELGISQEDADEMTGELLDQLKYELAQKGFSKNNAFGRNRRGYSLLEGIRKEGHEDHVWKTCAKLC